MSGATKGEQSGFVVMRWSWTGFVPLSLHGHPFRPQKKEKKVVQAWLSAPMAVS
jgi:hypothetical protein